MNAVTCVERIDRLIGRFDDLGVDGMLVHSPEGRRYFSGFTGSHAWLIISGSHRILFTDPRYTEQAGQESPGWDITCCGADRFGDLIRTLDGTCIGRLGFEADVLTVAEYREMTQKLEKVRLVPTTDVSVDLRSVKDDGEASCITRALEIAEAAFLDLAGEVRPGMTEREVAALLEHLMFRHGSEGPAFDTIAARGLNTSKPHHSPCGDTLGDPEALLLDFGARFEGYRSDITRMIFINREPEGYRRLVDVTGQALKAIEAVIRPGMTGAEADRIARDVYERNGLEQYTLRGLGHGVGLAIHEWPRVVMNSETVLLPGMICTLEPGVYVPGSGGVRIEDLVLITDSGAKVLNRTPWTVTVTSS